MHFKEGMIDCFKYFNLINSEELRAMLELYGIKPYLTFAETSPYVFIDLRDNTYNAVTHINPERDININALEDAMEYLALIMNIKQLMQLVDRVINYE